MSYSKEEMQSKLLKYKWKFAVGDKIIAPSGRISYVTDIEDDEIFMVNADGQKHSENAHKLISFFEDHLIFDEKEYTLERGCGLDDDLFTI
jgi:hypothetical protein